MTFQELATVLIATIGANSAVLLCVWKLSEKLNGHKLKQQPPLFSARKQIFCERQEEAFAHTYSLLMDCHRKLFFLGDTNNLSEYKAALPPYEAVHSEASQYSLAKCFYFTPELFETTQKLLLLYNEMTGLYRRGHQLEHHGAQYGIDLDTLKSNKAEADKLLKDIKDLLYKTLSAGDEPK